MSPSSVRVRPNVLCTQRSDGFVRTTDEKETVAMQHRSDADTIARLGYWELTSLRAIAPLRFWYDRDNLTDRQKAERDAFIREGERGAWSGAQVLIFRKSNPIPATA